MKMLTLTVSSLALSLALVSGASAEPAGSQSKIWAVAAKAQVAATPQNVVYDAATAMEYFRNLTGEWKHEEMKAAPAAGAAPAKSGGYGDAENADMSLVTTIAAGSTVMERVLVNSPYEMTIMYHMDGVDKMLLTHYCAAKNVPQSKFVPTGKPGEMVFKFDQATNVNPAVDTFGHSVTYQIIDKDHYVQTSWVSSAGKLSEPRVIKYYRVVKNG